MDILLEIMGGSLGLLVPGLFIWALSRGIERAPFDAAKKVHHKRIVAAVVALWTAVVWVSSLTGVIDYHEGDRVPRVVFYLFAPVLAGLVALARSADLRTILDHTPLAALVGAQSFRFAGAAFLLVVYLGILPPAFASGGYGDLVTATLATAAALLLGRAGAATAGAKLAFWGFTLAGLLDLLNVAYLLLAYYPSWYHSAPSSAPLAAFALVMVPAIAAPFALLLHTYAIRSAIQRSSRDEAHEDEAGSAVART